MSYVDVIEQAVDAAVLLVNANEEWDRMTSITGNLLQVVDQLSCLFSSYESSVMGRRERGLD